ncbi:hypothetical protein FB45DRAFT_979716 [Roridomyces roridus]|uniref:Transposase n=1 Tax=Roridomyces roridus TaxID=1738132 RepID=A0AAD7BQB9_9AGAR|nr:hypothetical protein FB45DRAFT_979716 [Roridomyces roridus]
MPNRRIEDSAKIIALRLLNRKRDSRPEIAQLCGFSVRTLGRTVRRFRTTGSVAKAAAIGRGRPRLLHTQDSNYLLKLARHNPCYFLDEYQHFLEKYRHMPVHISTVHRTFERAGLSLKHIQKMASEKDPLAEGLFINRISRHPAHYIVALDEMSKDDRTYEGSADRETFIHFLQNDVV